MLKLSHIGFRNEGPQMTDMYNNEGPQMTDVYNKVKVKF